MTFKQILTLGYLLAVGCAGNVWADRDEEDKVASYLGIARGAGLDPFAICSSYCSNHHNDGECTDYGQFGGSWDPATLKAVNQCGVVSAIVSYYQQKEGTSYSYFCHTPPPNGCFNQTSDGMRYACNDVCSKITSRSLVRKSAHVHQPLIVKDNHNRNSQNAHGKNASPNNHPAMMHPLNQGRAAPHQGLKSTTPGHSHEIHAPAHSGMMHVAPHNPAMMHPLNQGRYPLRDDASSVSSRHDACGAP